MIEKISIDRPFSEYPIGTKAHSYYGGFWTKVDSGWQWGSSTMEPGSIFPSPGIDAFGKCIELPDKE